MSLAGATELQCQEFRYALNLKPASLYKSEFPVIISSLRAESFHMHSWTGCLGVGNESHPNRNVAAKLLGCHPDDLLVRGFSFVIRK
jgi:hypothetical protein